VPESRVLAEPLWGGRTTLGVVKIGETVRRPATPNSVFVRSLLMHLELSGFAGAPRYLGMDEDNRDVFSYLPGEVPSELGEREDQVLQAAARLIRGFHDATAALVHSDAAACSGLTHEPVGDGPRVCRFPVVPAEAARMPERAEVKSFFSCKS